MAQAATPLAPEAFGSLLRRWRTQRKLSQLDLALESDVSQRHLSFLESGRARPSAAMVMQLAEALEVPLRERNALLTAAGFAALYHERALDDATMSPVLDALERMLRHHEPYPAVVVDRDYNLLMENPSFGRLLALFGDVATVWRACCGDGPRNLLRLSLHAAGARPFIRNFDEVGAGMLLRAYRETQSHGSPAIRAFLDEMRRDPAIPAQWHVPPPGSVLPPVLPLALGRDGVTLNLFTMISTFGTPVDITTDELRVETFFPADDFTEAFLRGGA